jgi:hypothetical protein
MSTQPAPAEPQTLSDQQAVDAQYYRQILHGLIDVGANLARQLPQQAEATPAPEIAVAFDRIARAVRRTIILARKVAEPAAAAAEHPDQRRAAARRRIIREVEDTIQRTTGDADAETLHAELLDRLDAPDLDDDIDNRPIADIIADICRDLGLAALPGTHPWKRRTAEDLTALCARAAQTRTPRAAAMQPAPSDASDPPAKSLPVGSCPAGLPPARPG